MSDSRYPWEKDPLSEPPHTAQRFDNNLELVARLKARLEVAKDRLDYILFMSTGNPEPKTIHRLAKEALAEIAKLEGGRNEKNR